MKAKTKKRLGSFAFWTTCCVVSTSISLWLAPEPKSTLYSLIQCNREGCHSLLVNVYRRDCLEMQENIVMLKEILKLKPKYVIECLEQTREYAEAQ